jgi:hypothetical protein
MSAAEQRLPKLPTGLRGEDFADMRPRLDIASTIKGLLAPSTLAAVIGASGSGKTFFSTCMGCHIAAGMQFYARKTSRGLVIYCALEGGASARNRFSAWRLRHLAPGQSIPLRSMIDSINLRDPVDQLRLVEFIRAAESEHGEKCALVIVDTLSRAMAGGNENGPEDMGALVAGADTVRNATGAAVLLVHHLGKDESRGARGHNLFRAALDTEIEIAVAGDQRVATVTKQRDWPEGDKFAFTLNVVELGKDSDGELVTSCVIQPCDAMPEPRPEMRGKAQRQLLHALRGRDAGKVWTVAEMRTVGRELAQSKGTARSAVEALSLSPYMTPTIGGYRLAD